MCHYQEEIFLRYQRKYRFQHNKKSRSLSVILGGLFAALIPFNHQSEGTV